MGTEYQNSIIEDFCKNLKIENTTSFAHHHQTVETVERSHRTINEFIWSYISINKSDWDVWLPYFTYCFKTTSFMAHDYCPYELIFGRTANIDPLYNLVDYAKEAKFRLELAHKSARLMLDNNKIKQKIRYDKNNKDFDLKIGDQVLILGFLDVDALWSVQTSGPYDTKQCLLRAEP